MEARELWRDQVGLAQGPGVWNEHQMASETSALGRATEHWVSLPLFTLPVTD